ncbi:hypothetical protein BM613_12090 [Sulfoacidibacillus thermotolerans]|uniref:Peptidase S24/S26A/S26B/S26C domain-containing protein n=1 Tax=Sulfoacidibacillus thermotolerans TaxID=1765684 RepID=A0A2U3D660_SULT2|nr:hypothetical protein BM613_12090 [Sulfoacidibacillus thermotolerans]
MPFLWISGESIFVRFAVRLCDHGFEGLGFSSGDYLIFAHSGWPTKEGAVCFLRIGQEAIVRRIEDVFAMEPLLSVTGDRAPSIRLHRNEFIVQGQLVGVIRANDVQWVVSQEASLPLSTFPTV